jgi:hypothetical protein
MSKRVGRIGLVLSVMLSSFTSLSIPNAAATGNTIFTCSYSGGLQARAIDGTGSQTTISSTTGCVEIDAAGDFIYMSYGSIRRINKNGTGLITLRTISDQLGLLINGSYIYYGYEYGRKIGRMNLDGTGANDSWIDFSANASAPYSAQLVIVGTNIYFGGGTNSQGKSIWKVPVTGGTPTLFINDADAQAGINGIDSDGTYIYWTDYRVGEIGRAALDGSSTTDNWITGLSSPWGIQVADSYIYFNHFNHIGRVLRDGTGLQGTWLSNSSVQGLAIADAGVNSTSLAGDTTAPTFPSADTFNTPENSTSVGTIVSSESSTITLFGGEDVSKFSLIRSSDSSAALSFATAPNFEAPTDTGTNNTYVVVLKAVDGASNAGYETVTVTVTDVNDTANVNTFGLASNATTANYKTASNITINVTVASRVTFLANGKRIAGCIKKATSGTSPNIIVTCSWSPTTRGSVVLTALVTPVDQNIASLTSTSAYIRVGNRSGNR